MGQEPPNQRQNQSGSLGAPDSKDILSASGPIIQKAYFLSPSAI